MDEGVLPPVDLPPLASAQVDHAVFDTNNSLDYEARAHWALWHQLR